MRRDGAGDLRYELTRPGKKYIIATDRAAGRVRVEGERTGLGNVVASLHGHSGELPGSNFMLAWGFYTEATT